MKKIKRRDSHKPPESIEKWGWKYHHLGIPTSIQMPDEKYLPNFKVYTSGFDTSPFGIEWMRYEPDSPIDKRIQRIPHIAFEVKDLDKELVRHDFNIINEPNPPSEGVRVAMTEHNGAIIELIEFEKNK